MLEFKTAARRKDPIHFTLDGRTFSFVPPKTAVMVLAVVAAEDDSDNLKAMFDWLDQGLSTADSEHLEARLRDKDDDLDVDMLAEIVKGLIEEASGRPPTSPNA